MSIYERYINYVKTIDLNKPETWTFKSNPEYTYMLEHVNVNFGNMYLELIRNKYPELYNVNKNYLISLCSINDAYGVPYVHDFKDFARCSPTNLRYIFHSLLVLDYMKENNLNNIDCIEIGGGYGGECFFLKKLSFLYKIHINSYTIFDLLEASKLQKSFLKNLELDVNCYQLENFNNLPKNSFLISNYAFSEIPLEIQSKYTELVLNPYVSIGHLCWNNIPVYNFIENGIIEKEEEYPKTGLSNYYVKFKVKNS